MSIISTPAFAEPVNNPNPKDIIVAGKIFNDSDCIKYLGRPIRDYGYQPIQLIIKNKTDKSIIFSLDQVSLPCEKVEKIAQMGHTATALRVTTYGVLALFSSALFIIPAVVDGFASYNANSSLDSDYYDKALKSKTIIKPNKKINGIIFVPMGTDLESFHVNLHEEDSNKFYCIPVTI